MDKATEFIIENLITNEELIIITEDLKNIIIIEKGPLSLSKETIDKAKEIIIKKLDLKSKSDLEYIGYTDIEFMTPGQILAQFNVLDKTHPKFRSTVACKVER